jgi:hypothetical protein
MPRVSGLDPGKALHAGSKVIVGIRPIHQPPSLPASIAGRIAPAPVILRQIGIFQPDEMKLGLGRKGRPRTFILLARAEPLCQRADGQPQQRSQDENETRQSAGPEVQPAGHSCP